MHEEKAKIGEAFDEGRHVMLKQTTIMPTESKCVCSTTSTLASAPPPPPPLLV